MRLLALALLLCACATAPAHDVNVQLEQVTTFADLRYAGPVNVEYRVTVTNDTDAPVTLTRLELRTAGPGAYTLREPALPLNLTVPAHMASAVAVTARGNSTGGHSNSVEPVTVRATAYLNGPTGATTRLINATFGQFGRD